MEPRQTAADEAIRGRLRGAQRMRGDFAAVHATPASPQEVPDQAGARLVVLGPEHPHSEGSDDSPALARARELLADAGGAPRAYPNMLVFLAADAARLDTLRREPEAPLNETWRWVLAPVGPTGWSAAAADGREELAMRAARRLRADGNLFVEYPPARLAADLDRLALWPDHVTLAAVWEAYASSLELPRLRSSAVLAAAVLAGVAAGEFAYAESFDRPSQRFDGLLAGPPGNLALKGSGLIVRLRVARAQLDG